MPLASSPIFDHCAPTIALADDTIDPEILDARNIAFCFGIALQEQNVLALGLR